MRKKVEIIGFCLSWFAIIMQFVLMMQNRQAEPIETIIRFFSFFTILTNSLVALCFTYHLFKPKFNGLNFFNRKGAFTALTTFILIVGLIYQLLLRDLWNPQGFQKITDELLHGVIPIYFLIYWSYFSGKEKVIFFDVFKWLIYPLIYLIFVLTRGHLSNFYPYPFLNLKDLGIGQTLLNAFFVFILMLVIMTFLAIIKNKFLKK